MKLNLPRLALFLFTLFSPLLGSAQLLQLSPANASKLLAQLQNNTSISADELLKTIHSWHAYPGVDKTGVDYKYVYADSVFGDLPVRVFIPASYKNTVKTTCILLLHGATSISHLADADSLAKFDDDVLYQTLKKQNYIIIRPVAEKQINFDWAAKPYNGTGRNQPNYTYKALTSILASLKKVLNIDDEKVIAMGHSDGSDGAIGQAIYSPNMFAGVVAYNSMLYNLFAGDYYIRNIVNRPLYIVHSGLDTIRRIVYTRNIVNALKEFDKQIIYKEYAGYAHQDKHLDIDLPYAVKFIDSVRRNPYKDSLYWQATRDTVFNTCDWLKLTHADFEKTAAPWDKEFNIKVTARRGQEFPYYYLDKDYMALKAFYHQNTFTIESSRIKEIEIKISPAMVDMAKPIIINVNGKQVFKGIVKPDKAFILQSFKNDFDRGANWVAAVKVKVE
jgi:predicted esterase